MRFTLIGAGAVGGYYAALLSRAGHDVGVIARGAHLEAIRARGIEIRSEAVGSFVAKIRAERDPATLGTADVVILTTKTYDNASAIPMIKALVAPGGVGLTVQNGVDSIDEVTAIVGPAATIAGATYIATAIAEPGVIAQTGSHRRVVFGECGASAGTITERVRAIETAMKGADIHAEAVPDARPPIWEKFVYLAPFASITGASRLPLGPLWADPDSRMAFLGAVSEVEAVARASGIALPDGLRDKVEAYANMIPPTTRSSLLIDLSQGKRIEIESLTGSVVRRGRALGVPTPRMEAWYAVLKPYTNGPPA